MHFHAALALLAGTATAFVVTDCQGHNYANHHNDKCYDWDVGSNSLKYQSNAGCVITMWSGTGCTGRSYTSPSQNKCLGIASQNAPLIKSIRCDDVIN